MRLAEGAALLDAAPGQHIFARGDPAPGLHIVASGEVTLTLHAQGGEIVVAQARRGASLGTAWVLLAIPHALTATTRTRAKLVYLTRVAVRSALRHDSVLAQRIIAQLCNDVRLALDDVEAYTLRTGTERVAAYLLARLARNPHRLLLSESKREIAKRLNLTHEHFSRILHELASDGVIAVAGPEIEIRDVARLRACGR